MREVMPARQNAACFFHPFSALKLTFIFIFLARRVYSSGTWSVGGTGEMQFEVEGK